MSDRIFTVPELAERWMCSTHAIYNLIRENKLRAFQVGREHRVTSEEVARFESGEVRG